MLAAPLNISFDPGEVWLLAGKNGSGKSTLLKTLAGLIPPLNGEWIQDQWNFFTAPPSVKAALTSIAFSTPPEGNLLTAMEMAETSRWRFQSAFGPTNAQVPHLMPYFEMAGIAHLAHRIFNELSDGEKQKVMLVRCLAQETQLVLLDEPTAFLDYPSRISLFKLIRNLCNQWNKIFFISTHDLDFALPHANGLIFLDAQGNAHIYKNNALANLNMEWLFQHHG